MTPSIAAAAVRDFQDTFAAIRREIAKVVIGHEQVIETILVAFFAGGHVLIEGVPGIGKTLIVRSLAEALNLRFNRIQFTVDLMPADITGTRVIDEAADGRREFHFVAGPVFAHVLLADEINRATPKTQSALLEAMAEQQVTVAGTSYPLASPFFVLATLNPIEMEGTYQLPEAQLDRFLFKVLLEYPTQRELERIVAATTSAESAVVTPVLARDEAAGRVEEMKRLVRQVLVAPHVERYVAGLVRLTLPATGAPDPGRVALGASDPTSAGERRPWLRGLGGRAPAAPAAADIQGSGRIADANASGRVAGVADASPAAGDPGVSIVGRGVTSDTLGVTPDETVTRYVAYGASPRGGQALMLGAKVVALLEGRPHVTFEDVDRVALPALRHRLVMNFAAEAARIDAGHVLGRVLVTARRLRA